MLTKVEWDDIINFVVARDFVEKNKKSKKMLDTKRQDMIFY